MLISINFFIDYRPSDYSTADLAIACLHSALSCLSESQRQIVKKLIAEVYPLSLEKQVCSFLLTQQTRIIPEFSSS